MAELFGVVAPAPIAAEDAAPALDVFASPTRAVLAAPLLVPAESAGRAPIETSPLDDIAVRMV